MIKFIRALPAIPNTMALTPERVIATSGLLIIVSYAVYIHAVATADGLTLQAGPPVGGDYVAFWGAARAVLDGLAGDIYQMANFEAYLMEVGPERDRYGLSWQYPPTYYFFIMPLAALPFLAGHVIWSGGTMALFLTAHAKALRLNWLGIGLLFALPVTFNAVITGQNGFLTATLLVVAAVYADKRPILAGIAAGLLTFKPQLGILLPFAYIAAGCWRAFFVAAATALLMAGTSVIAFGPETWQAFMASVISVGDGVQKAIYPIQKMPTVFAALSKSGVPSQIAMAIQVITALGAITLVSLVWRQVTFRDLRAATLCAAAFLCTPYAYYYEMTLLVYPVAVLVMRAIRQGWRPMEEIGVALLWVVPMFLPGWTKYAGAQIGLAIVLFTLYLVIRHVADEAGWRQLRPIRLSTAT